MNQLDLFAAPPRPAPPPALPDTRHAAPDLGQWFNQVKAHAEAGGTTLAADPAPPAAPVAAAPEPTPAPTAQDPAPVERSHHFEVGAAARREGLERIMPAYFAEPERDPKWRASRQRGIDDFLAGWDSAADPAPVGPDSVLLSASEVEPNSAPVLADYSAKCPDDATRGRFAAHLRACLGRKRECMSADGPKERKKAAARVLDRTDIRRAFRAICPRPFADVAADAWTFADEYDRLCRDQAGDAASADRRATLRQALDELMIEANGGTSMGVKVYRGPKRLMKALRVRARAEGRWPMWGLDGRYRFAWRGLTMIACTRYGLSISLDTDRHRPGTLCHSSTGFRSFISSCGGDGDMLGSPAEFCVDLLNGYADAPRKSDGGGGLGGKLERFVPWWLDDYRRVMQGRKEQDAAYRAKCPAMMKDDERPAYWAEHDAKAAATIAKAEAKARAIGLDLVAFFPDLQPPAQSVLL